MSETPLLFDDQNRVVSDAHHPDFDLGFEALPAADRLALSAHLTIRSFKRGESLTDWRSTSDCHFISSGLAALTVKVDEHIDVGILLLGRGDGVGIQAALGATPASLPDVLALTECTVASASVEELRRLAAASEPLRRHLHGLIDRQLAATMRTAACNARHGVERRLARWILDADDRSFGSPLHFTHQQLAALLGVQRVTITLALQKLEGDRAIRANRGLVVIRDRARLEQLACSCHGPAKRTSHLLSWFAPAAFPWLSDIGSFGELLLC
ncbi:MAG: Crp/Fnr family transcriptional regulator [Bauldia sp.]